jgi:hypothetical protein
MLSIGMFAFVASSRELGLLQPTDFLAYDKFLAWEWDQILRILASSFVKIMETDIAKYDFSVPNDLLAKY